MLKLKDASYPDPERLSLVDPYSADIDLAGKDGSTWKHGYIPTNPAAVALKHHKSPGGGGGSTAKGIASRATGGSGRTKADIHKAAVDRAAKVAQDRHARLNGFKVVGDEPTAAKSETRESLAAKLDKNASDRATLESHAKALQVPIGERTPEQQKAANAALAYAKELRTKRLAAKKASKPPQTDRRRSSHDLPTPASIKAFNERERTRQNSETHSLGSSRRSR